VSLFLSFLPILPSQILLNNLLYDVGQLAIPTDRVDEEVLRRPAGWDIAFVRRFMAVFGPVSSLFDFMTFWVMLVVLDAGHREFRTGWFVESLATQTLVVFIIRTRRVPFLRSRPSRAMIALPIVCAAVGAILPFTPIAHALGFASLPLEFFLILVALTAAYLILVEAVKARFYAQPHRPQADRPRHAERHHRHIRRRAARFARHGAVAAWPRRSEAGQATVPTSAPMPAVVAIATAPQARTRIVARVRGAPPRRAPRSPSNASAISVTATVTPTRAPAGVTTTASNGSVAPVANDSAEVQAA
jgi:Cation transporting ATPase, C-terminus